ncbi:SCO family protein [Aureimonas sp. SK2]|uniref:SCO family protein n=1 Tax=Aureimonas sp. SK2 TaxID=3015992 RepID=UPI0024451BE5|nr:SCO family protein [Aureimonas sp. SK2]
MSLRALRTLLWLAVGLAAVALVGIAWNLPSGRLEAEGQGATATIGGDFSLVDQDGRSRTWADFRGKPVAVFFGFTNCPDICPTTLGELSVTLADLDKAGGRGDDLQVMLVTGDPERDTPAVLDTYLQSFDPRIVGLTGAEAEVDRAFSVFKAYRRKVPLENGGYTMDHSAGIYLYDASGKFTGTLDLHEDADTRRRKVERLLDSSEGRASAEDPRSMASTSRATGAFDGGTNG